MLVAALCLAGAVSALAGDIVTVPTANQLKAKEFDIAAYYIRLDRKIFGAPPGADVPKFVTAQTLYVGVTDDIEVDLHAYQVDDGESYVVPIVTYRLLAENAINPNVVIGVRNLTQSSAGKDPDGKDLDKVSFYLAAAKTVNVLPGVAPKFPIVRLHLGVGTKDNTILGANRHSPVFGGVQLRMSPTIGIAAMHDSRDLITALTYDPFKELTVKGGTYGTHWWVGVSYAKSF